MTGQISRLQAQSDIKKVDDFCYLGSYISHNGSCEKDVRVCIGKATAVFGKMRKIWKNKCINLKVKMRLYKLRSNSSINPSVQRRGMATNSNTNEKAELNAAHQMAKEHLGYLLEGQSNK